MANRHPIVRNTAGNNLSDSKTVKIIRNSLISAQSKVYAAVNSAMVQVYWEIGEQIYIACNKNDRAKYGEEVLSDVSNYEHIVFAITARQIFTGYNFDY